MGCKAEKKCLILKEKLIDVLQKKTVEVVKTSKSIMKKVISIE